MPRGRIVIRPYDFDIYTKKEIVETIPFVCVGEVSRQDLFSYCTLRLLCDMVELCLYS